MKHFLLTYTLAPDYLERRPAYRDAHLAYAWAAIERGERQAGGQPYLGHCGYTGFAAPSPTTVTHSRTRHAETMPLRT